MSIINNDGDLRLGMIVFWIVVVIAACFALTAGIFGLRVATAGIVGRGQETIQIQSAANRIGEQEKFAQLYNDIQKWPKTLANTRGSLASAATDDDKSRLSTVLLGQQNLCVQNVADYNALTEKVSAEDFRDQSFPANISNSDVYCK